MIQTTSVDPQTPFYIVDRIYANLEHKLTNRITAVLGCEYYQDDYSRSETVAGDTRVRLDKTVKPQIGLKYYFTQDFFADLYYTYTKRTSNFNANDYVDNKITTGLNVPF
jgi:uncharacterized protein (PEP-CTERM system associated)